MGKVLEALAEAEKAFIAKQKVFFVATAPLSSEHHINVSPKAPGSSVVVIDSHTVAYCDFSGSGAETAAHLIENGRITLLFCNIEAGPPKLLRIHGTGSVIPKEDAKPSLLAEFDKSITSNPGFRAVYLVKVDRISSSCGYSMPVMKFEKYRNTLDEWTIKKGSKGMDDYRLQKNSFSIDGLPSLSVASKHTLKGQEDSFVIAPVEQEGYIYGKLIQKEEGDSRSYNPHIPRTTKEREGMNVLTNVAFLSVAFLVGYLFGSGKQIR